MLSPIKVLTFIFILWHVDCSVIVHQTGVYVGDDCYECGEQLVLSCKIDSYSISMSWQNDSSSVPFAQCIINTCTLDQDVANSFVFSANTSTGIFNLTFNVSIYNNGTTYMCSDGSTTYSSLVLTKDYRPTFNNTISGQLIAMSGCVNKDAIVQFEWEQEDGDIYSPTYVDDNQPREISCLLDTECGAANSIKHVRTIEVEQGGARGQRLKVIVSYDGFPVGSFLTEEKYIVKVPCVWGYNDDIYLGFMITFLVCNGIFCPVFLYCIFGKVPEKNDVKSLCVGYTLTIVFSIPLLVTVVMSFYKFDPGQDAFDDTCKRWTIFGITVIVWLFLQVCLGLTVVFCIRKECEGSKTCVRNVNCVQSMFFFNFLGFFILFSLWIIQKTQRKRRNKQENLNLERASKNEKGLVLPPLKSTAKPGTAQTKLKENLNEKIKDAIDGKKGNSTMTERKNEKSNEVKERRDVQPKPLTSKSSTEKVSKDEESSTTTVKKNEKSNEAKKIRDGELNVHPNTLASNNSTEKVSKGEERSTSAVKKNEKSNEAKKRRDGELNVHPNTLASNNATENVSKGQESSVMTERKNEKSNEAKEIRDVQPKPLPSKSSTEKVSKDEERPAEIKNPIHIDVQTEKHHQQSTDTTTNNGPMNRGLSALFSQD